MTERKKWKLPILHATPQKYRWNIHAKSCSQWGQQLYFHYRFDVHCHRIWITFLLIVEVTMFILESRLWERNKNTKYHLLQRFSVDISFTFSSQKMRKCKFVSAEWVEHIIWDFLMSIVAKTVFFRWRISTSDSLNINEFSFGNFQRWIVRFNLNQRIYIKI